MARPVIYSMKCRERERVYAVREFMVYRRSMRGELNSCGASNIKGNRIRSPEVPRT